MKVTIQKNKLRDGDRSSIYLSFSSPLPHPTEGKSIRKYFIGSWVYNLPRNPEQKAHNKTVLNHAKLMQSDITTKVLTGDLSFLIVNNGNPDTYVAHFEKVMRKHKDSTQESMTVALRNVRRYDPKNTLITKIDKVWLAGLQDFMAAKMKPNSASTQMAHVRAVLNDAYREGLIERKITDFVKPLKKVDVERAYLTKDELDALERTPCRNEILKRASLFSSYTGLRISDVEKVRVRDFEQESDGIILRYKAKKTSTYERLPLSKKALQFIDDTYSDDEIQFPELRYYAHKTPYLKQWVKSAGITKCVSFHVFRHTFATLALKHADLYTVSKLLGHADVKTTTIYAKLQMGAKRAVVDLL